MTGPVGFVAVVNNLGFVWVVENKLYGEEVVVYYSTLKMEDIYLVPSWFYPVTEGEDGDTVQHVCWAWLLLLEGMVVTEEEPLVCTAFGWMAALCLGPQRSMGLHSAQVLAGEVANQEVPTSSP